MSSRILTDFENGKSPSEEFRKRFIYEFTRHLIINSAPIDVLKFQQEMMEKSEKKLEKPVSEDIKEIVHETLQPLQKTAPLDSKKELFPKRRMKGFGENRLFIPKIALPERFNYLRPSATNQGIDLGELNPYLGDPLVKTIECPGEGSNILVRGSIGNKKTAVILDENAIRGVIQKFSEASKIPLQEGFFKVAVGRYVLMAIYSESVGSKFIIQKIMNERKF
jgi:hypothetical protein